MSETLEKQLKELIVTQLELDRDPTTIKDNEDLFGRGLGLDSVDSLAIIAGIDEKFKITITDDDLLEPEKIFTSIKTLADFVRSKQ